jgi:hypothetical protein
LAQLERSLGRLEILEGSEFSPTVLMRTSMSRVSIWRRVSGKGSAAVFEQEREE